MTPESRRKRRFEPPPWEAEAFEQFRRERERAEAQKEIHEEQPVRPQAAQGLAPSEAEIQGMLEDLRAEEGPAARASIHLVHGAAGLMGGLGVFLVVKGLTLAVRVQQVQPTGRVLAITATAVVLVAGAGCIAGAIGLCKKHRE